MNRRLPAASALIAFAFLVAACGSGDGHASSEDLTSTTAAKSAAGGGTGLAAAQGGLDAEIGRLMWPDDYTPTVKSLTPKLGDPKEIILAVEDGTSMANIWNLCAWVDEGVDRIAAGATPAQLDEVATRITDWVSATTEPLDVEEIVEGIRTGDPTGANRFIEANGCRPFPS